MNASLPPITSSDEHSRRPLSVFGVSVEILLTSHQTSGACTVIRIHVPTGTTSPPHVHWYEDETFYVIEGELEVTVAGQPATVQAGMAAFAPKRVIHSFANRADAPAVAVVCVTPGGLDRFLEAVDAAYPQGRDVDPVGLVALIERHGMSVV